MTHPDIVQLLDTCYGITAELTRLAGENENYLVKSNTGEVYVLKLADSSTTTPMIELEYLAVARLKEDGLSVSLPGVILTREEEVEAVFTGSTGETLRGRLLSFVEGSAWCECLPAPESRHQDLGRILGRMNRAMAAIVHPGANRTHHWDLSLADQHRESIPLVADPDRQAILEQVFLWFDAIFVPRRDALPKGPIHGDVNDDNVLVQGDRVSGILDFGDCLVNPLVCDLAIALAYHMLDEDDPLTAGAAMVGAYHRERPLTRAELVVLFPLVCARLAVSVIISARRRGIDPDRASWFVSEERAWKKLALFAGMTPADAARALAARTGIIPHEPPAVTAPELAAARAGCIAPSLSLSYETPLRFVRGQAQYLYDDYHRPFLDLYNNVCHVGHCHPHVVAAGQKQIARLNTNTRYLYDGLTDYASRLTATLPKGLSHCFFVNSGSEANELALRMAKTVTGREDVLVVENAYHGHTQAMIHISPYKFMGKGGRGRPEPWVHMVPVADGYRGKYKGMGADTGRAYGDDVGRIINTMTTGPAAFITESLLSCGGQVIPPRDYFKTAFAHVRKAGGLCICDEVQTGFGRTGTHFWGFEAQEVVPDIVVMGKPIGNGHPMSCVVTTEKIARQFANGMEFFATFGGNPVSCAIGMAVLDVIEAEGLQHHARAVGGHLLQGLSALKEKHRLIGDVRGTGLFIGIELVEDRETLTPATRKAALIVNRLQQAGILLGTDGPHANVIKIKPPMVITREDGDMFVRTLDRILTQMD